MKEARCRKQAAGLVLREHAHELVLLVLPLREHGERDLRPDRFDSRVHRPIAGEQGKCATASCLDQDPQFLVHCIGEPRVVGVGHVGCAVEHRLSSIVEWAVDEECVSRVEVESDSIREVHRHGGTRENCSGLAPHRLSQDRSDIERGNVQTCTAFETADEWNRRRGDSERLVEILDETRGQRLGAQSALLSGFVLRVDLSEDFERIHRDSAQVDESVDDIGGKWDGKSRASERSELFAECVRSVSEASHQGRVIDDAPQNS